MARDTDFAFQQQLPNAAAGDDLAAQAHFGIHDYLEAELSSEFLQFFTVAFGAMPKMETQSLMHFAGAQASSHDGFGKIARGGRGELPIEGKHENGIDARLVQRRDLLPQRRDQQGSA